MKCDRCGKEIKDNDYRYTASVPNLDDEVETSIWCKECHDEFVDSLTRPTKEFENVRPSYIDENEIRKYLKKWEEK